MFQIINEKPQGLECSNPRLTHHCTLLSLSDATRTTFWSCMHPSCIDGLGSPSPRGIKSIRSAHVESYRNRTKNIVRKALPFLFYMKNTNKENLPRPRSSIAAVLYKMFATCLVFLVRLSGTFRSNTAAHT